MSNGSRTVTTPRGSKVRTASKCRYILVREWVERNTGTVHTCRVVKRSGNVETLRTEARRTTDNAGLTAFAVLTLIDTLTGEVLPS